MNNPNLPKYIKEALDSALDKLPDGATLVMTIDHGRNTFTISNVDMETAFQLVEDVLEHRKFDRNCIEGNLEDEKEEL